MEKNKWEGKWDTRCGMKALIHQQDEKNEYVIGDLLTGDGAIVTLWDPTKGFHLSNTKFDLMEREREGKGQ